MSNSAVYMSDHYGPDLSRFLKMTECGAKNLHEWVVLNLWASTKGVFTWYGSIFKKTSVWHSLRLKLYTALKFELHIAID